MPETAVFASLQDHLYGSFIAACEKSIALNHQLICAYTYFQGIKCFTNRSD